MRNLKSILILLLFVSPLTTYGKEVELGGESIGIQIEYGGVMVSGTYRINNYDPADNDIISGDLMIEVNNVPILNIADFIAEIKKYPNQEIQVLIKRDGKKLRRSLFIDASEKNVRSGLFVKDEIMGIGTLTYIDHENQTFASLGHEIIDSDTHQIVHPANGSLYESSVVSISKAHSNQTGEKNAKILFDKKIGEIVTNTIYGCYGYSYQNADSNLIETAKIEEITLGDAVMLTVLDDDIVETLDIEITGLQKQNMKDIKGIEFTLKDEKALNKTNGIVQGMSGSPIVQNGKLIGAVTHVATTKPQQGYGIYIEWMLEESEVIR